jgi:radical SAM superfamily enzyme YgiQ (UPF0313 family)
MTSPRTVLLVQLPIPPAGPTEIVGNVPLAAGYLKLLARQRGLEQDYDVQIFPPSLANQLSDLGIVEAILQRQPWMVGFTCYLWNIDRTIWICHQLKQRLPQLQIVLGGPEITADNGWVLEQSCVDFASIGEGEQTFAELLDALRNGPTPSAAIAGLWCRTHPAPPAFRQPLPHLNDISSPYLAGILDAADERMLMLETIRGCIFKCKFCYYPKSYDALYFVSREKIIANLRHAAERGAREVVLLDPTLNQRRDFNDFLRLLAEHNPIQPDGTKQFMYFGELRAEGINVETARLLREANFTEVEIGLQSVDPLAQDLMDRRNNMKAFERGVRAMLDAGIRVKVDLIIGLPGDTAASVRRGYEYLASTELFTDVQVFNLAILPGTAFRAEAEMLGLKFQPRPPYYVLETPTLNLTQIYGLMQEAQDIFDTDFDPFPPPRLTFPQGEENVVPVYHANLDTLNPADVLPARDIRTHAFTLWFRSAEWNSECRRRAVELVGTVLTDNPHSTLQVILEPDGNPERLKPAMLQALLTECYRTSNYLDRYYGLNPEGLLGSKRLLILVPAAQRDHVAESWIDDVGEFATLIWRGMELDASELEPHELCMI